MGQFLLSLLYFFGLPSLFIAGIVLLIVGFKLYKTSGKLTGKALSIIISGVVVSIVLPIFAVMLLLPV